MKWHCHLWSFEPITLLACGFAGVTSLQCNMLQLHDIHTAYGVDRPHPLTAPGTRNVA